MNDRVRNQINSTIMEVDIMIKHIESMFTDRHHTNTKIWQDAVAVRDRLLRILEDNKEVRS